MGKRHGQYGTITYTSWRKMLERCRNPNNIGWKNYGGRGIKVYGPWLDFESFLADMGRRPSKKHSIDRIDPNGDYEPGNCRWILRAEESKNRTTNHYVTFQGEALTVSDWGRRIGVKGHTITRRLRAGWPIEKALTSPPVKDPGRGKTPGNALNLTYQGETKPLAEWAREKNLDRITLWQRVVKYKWPVEKALTTPARGWAPGRPKKP